MLTLEKLQATKPNTIINSKDKLTFIENALKNL